MLSGLHMEITILAADPDCEPAFAPSDAAAVEKVNAGVKVAYVLVCLLFHACMYVADMHVQQRRKSWRSSRVP